MRIGIYSFQYPGALPFGGAGVYTAELAAGLVRAGHEVHVFTRTYDTPTTRMQHGVHLHHVKVPDRVYFRSIAFRRHLPRAIRDVVGQAGRFDVMHSNEPYVLRGFDCPTIMTVHHVVAVLHQAFSLPTLRGERNPWILWSERQSVDQAEHMIAVSPQSKLDLERCYPSVKGRVTAVLNGVDASVFESSDQDRRRRLGLENGQFLILSSPGNVEDDRKGLRYLFEALAHLPSDLDWRCVVLGRGSPRRYAPWLSGPNVGPRVEFPGFVEHERKIDLLMEADLFTMPSVLEGCPTAMLEAFAARCAVVATDVGGIPDLVRSERQGLLVPPRDAEALGRALRTLAEDDPARHAMARENLRVALEELSWDATARGTEHVYRRAIDAFASTQSMASSPE